MTEAQFASFGISLQFRAAFGSVCPWFSLTPVMMAGPASLSKLRAQVGAPSKAHSKPPHLHGPRALDQESRLPSCWGWGLTPRAVQLNPFIPAHQGLWTWQL